MQIRKVNEERLGSRLCYSLDPSPVQNLGKEKGCSQSNLSALSDTPKEVQEQKKKNTK